MADDVSGFPGELDTLPSAVDIDNKHIDGSDGEQYNSANLLGKLGDAVSAVQTKLGVTDSADTESLDFRIVAVEAGIASGVSDGDKGDITVSSAGAVWTVDNDAITYAQIQNVSATDKLLGRSTSGAGDVEEITCTPFARTILDDAAASNVITTLGLDSDLATFSVPASTTISTFGASLIDDAAASNALTTLGLDSDLATFAVPASTTISTFGASLVDDANAAASIATLGLDSSIATLTLPDNLVIANFAATYLDDPTASTMMSTIGLDPDLLTFSVPASTTISTFGASLIDDAAASNARTTLGLGTIATEAESGYGLLAGRSGGQTLNGGTADTDDLTLLATVHGTPATGSDIIFKSGTTQLAVLRKSGWTYHGPVASGYPQFEAQAPGIEFNGNAAGAVYSSNSGLGASFVGTEAHTSGATVNMRNSRGTVGSGATPLQSGDIIGGLRVGSLSSTPSFAIDCAQMYMRTTETHTSSATGTDIAFYTCPNGSTTKAVAFTIGNDKSATVVGPLFAATGALGTKTAAFNIHDIANAGTITMSGAALTLTCVNLAPAVTATTTGASAYYGYMGQPTLTTTTNNSAFCQLWGGFVDTPIVRANTGAGGNLLTGSVASFTASPTITVQDNLQAHTMTAVTGFGTGPTFNAGGATGTLTVTSYTAFSVGGPTIPANTTITNMRGLNVTAPTFTGTVTNYFAVDIPAITGAGTSNVGIRCTPAVVYPPTTCAVSSNAGTVPVSCSHAVLTNNSAATLTVTLATTGALNGQETLVRVFNSNGTSQTVTFTNSETGGAGAPPASFASATIPTSYRFIYNSGTSKWTYTGY